MAILDDGAIFSILCTRVKAFTGLYAFVPGEKVPTGLSAYVNFTFIEINDTQGGESRAACGALDINGVVCAGDVFFETYGAYALASVMAKLRAAFNYKSFSDSPVTHRVDLHKLDVSYSPVDRDNPAMRSAMFSVVGQVIRQSGDDQIVDHAEEVDVEP